MKTHKSSHGAEEEKQATVPLVPLENKTNLSIFVYMVLHHGLPLPPLLCAWVKLNISGKEVASLQISQLSSNINIMLEVA